MTISAGPRALFPGLPASVTRLPEPAMSAPTNDPTAPSPITTIPALASPAAGAGTVTQRACRAPAWRPPSGRPPRDRRRCWPGSPRRSCPRPRVRGSAGGGDDPDLVAGHLRGEVDRALGDLRRVRDDHEPDERLSGPVGTHVRHAGPAAGCPLFPRASASPAR